MRGYHSNYIFWKVALGLVSWSAKESVIYGCPISVFSSLRLVSLRELLWLGIVYHHR